MNWLFYTIGGAMANAANNLIIKKIASRADGLSVVAVAMIGGGLLILSYMYLWKGIKIKWDASIYGVIVLLSLLIFAIYIGFTLALKNGPVSLVSPLFGALMNVAVAIVGVLIFAEKMSLPAAAGVALTLLGAFFIARG